MWRDWTGRERQREPRGASKSIENLAKTAKGSQGERQRGPRGAKVSQGEPANQSLDKQQHGMRRSATTRHTDLITNGMRSGATTGRDGSYAEPSPPPSSSSSSTPYLLRATVFFTFCFRPWPFVGVGGTLVWLLASLFLSGTGAHQNLNECLASGGTGIHLGHYLFILVSSPSIESLRKTMFRSLITSSLPILQTFHSPFSSSPSCRSLALQDSAFSSSVCRLVLCPGGTCRRIASSEAASL